MSKTVYFWIDDIWDEFPDCNEKEIDVYLWLYFHRQGYFDEYYRPIPAFCIAIKSEIESRNVCVKKALEHYTDGDNDMPSILDERELYER